MALKYIDLYKLNPYRARVKLLTILEQNHYNFKLTARILGCSKNTVKSAYKREQLGLPLGNRSSRPKKFYKPIPIEKEMLVIKERKSTKFGKRRLAILIERKHKIKIPESTIAKILSRNNLSKRLPKRGKFKSNAPYYNWETIQPLQHFQIDLKEILDQDTLPYAAYQSIIRNKLPKYQWTAIDIFSQIGFKCYSYEKSFNNGLAFKKLIAFWIRCHGISHKIYFQTDWGEEFGGKSLRKLEQLQLAHFDPLNVQLLRIRKGRFQENAFVERLHRTDDEEFYIPKLHQINSLSQLLNQAYIWNYTYNTKRFNTGKYLKGLTPFEKLKATLPEIPKTITMFPPLLLDKICCEKIFLKRGQHLCVPYQKIFFHSPMIFITTRFLR